MSKKGWIILVVVLLVLAGYFAFFRTPMTTDESMTATSTEDMTDTTSVPGDNLTLGTDASDELGTYLVAWNGMTLYTYSPDTAGVSNCSGQCAVNWPPYIVTSTDTLVGESPIAGKISTITRTDGSMQITYNDAPLYFYIKDTNPGDTVGQAVGGVWYVVKP